MSNYASIGYQERASIADGLRHTAYLAGLEALRRGDDLHRVVCRLRHQYSEAFRHYECDQPKEAAA